MWRLNNTVSPELKELSNAGQPARVLTDLSSCSKAYEKNADAKFCITVQETIFTFSLQMHQSNVPYLYFWAAVWTSVFQSYGFRLPRGRGWIGLRQNLTIREVATETSRCNLHLESKGIVCWAHLSKRDCLKFLAYRKRSDVINLRLQSSKGTLNFMHTYGSVDSEWLLTWMC